MNTLEALFSDDRPGAAANAICRRVSNFLSPVRSVTKEEVGYLYNIRSRIVHGNIEASEDPNENLETLKKLEQIVIQTVQEFIAQDAFRFFKNQADRTAFMTKLD